MLSSFLTRIAWGNIRTKVKTLLFLGLTAFPLSLLVASESMSRADLEEMIALYAGAGLILLVPLAHVCSKAIALHSIDELNEFCLQMKNGNLSPFSKIPEEPTEGNALQRLRHNMFWMGHVLDSRQKVLATAKANLLHAQRQNQESLMYAERIQKAFLSDPAGLSDIFSEHFLLWEQRDGVGGDSYWIKQTPNGCFVAVIDCTGHGVPGAFMTLIIQSLFDRLTISDYERDPAALLVQMNTAIKNALSSNDSLTPDDGMDCTLLFIDNNTPEIVFAGAKNSLFIRYRNGSVREVKGDKRGVGNARTPVDYQYKNHTVPAGTGTRFYTLTDGLIDQIGGTKKLPFGKKRFAQYIKDSLLPLADQKDDLHRTLTTYQAKESRRDDILVLGFTI